MKTLFWEILARLGFRIPVAKYLPNPKYWDWVLVDVKERSTGLWFIPKIAECGSCGRWHFEHDTDFYREYTDVVYWHRLPRPLKDKIK